MQENVITEEAEDLELMIEDMETGEVYDTDDIEGQFSSMNAALPVALAIPWGIPIVWSALVSLFKVGAAIIAAGATYVVGTRQYHVLKRVKTLRNGIQLI